MQTSESLSIDGDAVEAVRAFNRFYTHRIGLLRSGLNDSQYSLTEMRLMYELAHGHAETASDLARSLDLDPGYVSRLVKKLHAAGLLKRAPSARDARQSLLSLSAKGTKTFGSIERTTKADVGTMLGQVPIDRRQGVLNAMQTIRAALSSDPPRAASGYLIRDPRPGDIGWVVHRQAVLYAAEYGWDATFEGLLAGIVGAFVKNFDPAAEHCWVAERDGAVVGSVFVVRKSARVAQLRMLYVEPSARGLGIGARLVDECVAFARARGYRSMVLWTNDILSAARKIYLAVGFTLVSAESHRSFGKDLVGQYWSLKL